MSSFNCEHCGAAILDSDKGYTTGCKHHPIERRPAEVVQKDNGAASFVFNNLKGVIERDKKS